MLPLGLELLAESDTAGPPGAKSKRFQARFTDNRGRRAPGTWWVASDSIVARLYYDWGYGYEYALPSVADRTGAPLEGRVVLFTDANIQGQAPAHAPLDLRRTSCAVGPQDAVLPNDR